MVNDFKTECNLRAYDSQKDGDFIYNDFIKKVTLYSSGILATSVSGFITLYDKVNISDLKIFFIYISFFSLISIIFGLLHLLIISYQKFTEATIHLIIGNNKTELKDKTFDKHKLYQDIGKIFFYITICGFILNCFIIFLLILNIK